MTLPFVIPLHLQDLELRKSDRICVRRVFSFESLDVDEITQRIKSLAAENGDTSQEHLGLLDQDSFDFAYSIIKKLGTMVESVQLVFLQTMTMALSSRSKLVRSSRGRDGEENMQMTRSQLVASVYFLVTLLTTISQRKETISSTIHKSVWGKSIENALHTLDKSINDDTFRLWRMNLPPEEFALLYSRTALNLLENTAICRSKAMKTILYQIIGSMICRVPSVRISTVTLVVDLLSNHEHVTTTITDLVLYVQTHAEYPTFPTDLLQIITSMSGGDRSKDVNGIKNVSTFLTTLATRSPFLILSNLTCVLGLFESESYQLRNAGVSCIGQCLLWNYRQQNQEEGVEEEDNTEQSEDEMLTTETSGHISTKLSRSTRDQLLTILQNRVHDTNSFTRSCVLKMWHVLCEHSAVPIGTLKKVMSLAIGRLQDKAAIVRRHSIALLTILLEHNPFLGRLEKEYHQNKLSEVQQLITKRREAVIAVAERTIDDENLMERQPEDTDSVEREVKALERLREFHTDAIDFIQAYESAALPLMFQLLGSKSTTDTLEAMQFIRQAHQLHLSGAESAIKRLLPLIWRSDVAVRDEVLTILTSIFLSTEPNSSSESPARPLLELLDDCTIAETTCLEKILHELQVKGQMPSHVVSALWLHVDEKLYPPPIITNALLLISMLAHADERVPLAGDRIDQLFTSGFGHIACHEDPSFRLLGAACRLVQNIQMDPESKSHSRRRLRVPIDVLENIVTVIQRFLVLEFVQSKHTLSSTWCDAVQQAIDAIFAVCEQPEVICADVIKALSIRLFSQGNKSLVHTFVLSHFLFVLGHVAVRTTIWVENVAASIKKLRANRELTRRSIDNTEDSSAMEVELGVSAEVEAEEDTFVHDIIRQEIVCRNLLGMYGSFVVRVCRIEWEDSKAASVMEHAVVTMSKFMAVSEDFCQQHLTVLFTLLQESPLSMVRANIIVALGDLAFRFPNLIEPWTNHLYKRLRDVEGSVRKNTAIVLSHLILNDMVKVKGHVSDLAISLVDTDASIRNLLKLFFHELSKKGNNPIYNMFPDTIGQLSYSDIVSRNEFEEITKFLLQFLSKDKQIESIVEKLCQRFGGSTQVKQYRDFSFCLAHLQHTEKSLRFMYQTRKIFDEPLMTDPMTRDHLKLVTIRARRQAGTVITTECKEAIDLLENYWSQVLNEQTEENELLSKNTVENAV